MFDLISKDKIFVSVFTLEILQENLSVRQSVFG